MTVWIAASIPKNSYGGVNRSMHMICDGLQNKGYYVELKYCKLKENYLMFALRLATILLFSSNKPDWIIARSTDGILCALLSKFFRLKTKVILHNHGWEEKVFEVEKSLPSELITNPSSWKSALIRFPLLRFTLRLSSYCICGTLEEGIWIARRHIKCKHKIKIIPNGIALNAAPYWPEKNFFKPEFLMIGGNTWKKNMEYGIAVFRCIRDKIPDATLLIIGKLNNDSILNDHSIQNIISIKPEEMYYYYKSFPFLLFTSRYEGGHAFTILEAQAMGMVVFATRIPSTNEIVSHGKTGYFLNGTDASADASFIKCIISDPQTIKKTGYSAYKSVQRHRIERQIQRLNALLTKH